MKVKLISVLFIFMLARGQISAQKHDLGFYVEQAKANSAYIHQNRNEKRLVELDMEQINKIYSRPEITLDAGILFAPILARFSGSDKFKLVSKDVPDYVGYDQAATDGGQYQATISVKQGLFNGKKVETFRDKTEIQKKISVNNIELTEHELENAVRHQYLLCLKSSRQAENNLELMHEVDAEVGLMEKLVQNAIYKQSDLKLLRITRQNYEQAYETYLAEYHDNLYNLNHLCGIEEGADVEIEPLELRLNPESQIPSRFMTSFYLDSLLIVADRKINELKYLPQVSVFANAGQNAVYLPGLNRFGFSTGATFSLTLYDGKQRKTEQHKSEINLETLQFNKRQNLTSVGIQKKFTLDKLQSLDKRILLSDNQLREYADLLDMYKKLLGQ